MRNQATPIDLIERQRRRRAELLGWFLGLPACVGILSAIVLYPVWSSPL